MKLIKLLLIGILFSGYSYAQVGINTLTPDPSSAMDITSNSQGLLVPRMTTLERTGITSPAESLLVFDTDEELFYYYNITTPSWIALANNTDVKRDNYKLIKSVDDLAEELVNGGGSSYLLTPTTYYEINGTINLTAPINLNNAYVSGMDTNEDILSSTGVVFQGATGGSIRNVTLRGTKAFEITGPGIATNSSLLLQNTTIDGMSTSVGNISGLGLYFSNIVQFVNNTNGITYSEIGNLLLNNQGWLANNNGTFETFTGNFGLIGKVSGFSSLNGADVAIDVSNNPAVGTGVLQGTIFSGTTTAPSGYVKRYTTGSYPSYNFTNSWAVASPGIPRENDDVATGDINLSAAVGSGELTTFTGTGVVKKVTGTTTSNSLFRFEKDGNNKIIYKGKKKRYFGASASISFQANNSAATTIYILYIAKGVAGSPTASVINQTKVYGRATTSSEIIALPIIGTIELDTDDYIEVWAERFSGNGDMLTVSLNLTLR
ncbi:MAG: hypothetical protein KBT58_02210 [Bizionia sp.]|nr:hypothetical protein [Bizionia sp.]